MGLGTCSEGCRVKALRFFSGSCLLWKNIEPGGKKSLQEETLSEAARIFSTFRNCLISREAC